MQGDRLVAKGAPSAFVPDEHDALVQRYAEIGERYKELWARYGPGNPSERMLKSLVSAIQVEVRDSAALEGRKMTDGSAEAQAHADPRTKEMLDGILFGRVQFAQAEIDLEITKEKLRRLDAVTRRGI